MSETRHHIPRIEMRTPEPDRLGMTPAILTRMTIDGEEWAVTDYKVHGRLDDVQQVTLTFLANVTISHE